MKKVLVTGGAGYIGSHTVVELISSGYQPIIFDDFSNSSPKVIDRIEAITNVRPEVIEGDIRDESSLRKLFKSHSVGSVIHFAGKKSVAESEEDPFLYFSVNITGTLALLSAMNLSNVENLVFSSSATVYRAKDQAPMVETDPLGPVNNYGKTKQLGEMVIEEIARLNPHFRAVLLRYFNPVGAHPSGQIGEAPQSKPNNLMPYITQVALGKLELLHIFGNDYKTRDGTGARDFLHVVDLAKAHVNALEYLKKERGVSVFNLGTGVNTTVLELVKAFENANNLTIPYDIQERRKGDSAICYADPSKAKEFLGWVSEKDITDMCRDSWNWQRKNPNGYDS
jgi:UDP-glucose 4-epimerase